MIAGYSSIFKKILKNYNLREKVRRRYFYRGRKFNDEIIIITKTFLYRWFFEKWFCIKNDFAKYFAKHYNLNILFYLFNNFSKWCISILHDKSNFLMLHDFMKKVSDTRENQIVNKCLHS